VDYKKNTLIIIMWKWWRWKSGCAWRL